MHSASSAASQWNVGDAGGAICQRVKSYCPPARRHSALPSPIGRCHGALYSPWPFCAPLWLPVALAGSPADSPTGLQLQMCLGTAHWLRHQLTASSDPRSRCLQIMPTRRPPTNSQCCSNLVRSALCSALLPSTANRHQQATKQSCWQSSAVYSAIQSSAAQLQTLLGTQKSVPARRPAGLQQTVSSFNPGRCPSPLPFSNSPSPP